MSTSSTGKIDVDEYQKWARSSNVQRFSKLYFMCALSEEVGEVAGKIKKEIRDNRDIKLVRQDVKKELGDVMWYLSNLAGKYDLKLSEILQGNIDKIESRKKRGKLQGSGDDR